MKAVDWINKMALEIEANSPPESRATLVSVSVISAIVKYVEEQQARVDGIAEQLVDLNNHLEEIDDQLADLPDPDLDEAEADLDCALAIKAALDIAHKYGGVDGLHHKVWVIDQMVRALTGANYSRWVEFQRCGADGPNTYGWDLGLRHNIRS